MAWNNEMVKKSFFVKRGDRYFLIFRKYIRLSVRVSHVGFGLGFNFDTWQVMILAGIFYLTVGDHGDFYR